MIPPLGKIPPPVFDRVICPKFGAPARGVLIGLRNGAGFGVLRAGGRSLLGPGRRILGHGRLMRFALAAGVLFVLAACQGAGDTHGGPVGAPCSLYLDWHTGNDGDLLTDAIAAGGCRPTTPPLTPFVFPDSPATVLAIAADSASPVSGMVHCGGVDYDIGDTTQGMRISHAGTQNEEVRCEVPSTSIPIVSIGFAYKTTLHTSLYLQYGQCGIQGIFDEDWAILSTYIEGNGSAHACIETNGNLWPATPSDGPTIPQNTWTWITIQYNRTLAKAYLRAYLMSTWQPIGSQVEAHLVASPPPVWCVDFGQVASEGNSESGANSWYGPAMVDWEDGTFPLLPAIGTSQAGVGTAYARH